MEAYERFHYKRRITIMRKKMIPVFLTFFMTLFAWQVSAQLTFRTTSPSTIAYYEYLPSDYNSNSNKYPVVIFLHGIGERGPNTTDKSILADNIYKVAKLGPPKHVKNGYRPPFILISPQLKSNYGSWPTWYVLEVINYVKKKLRIDEKRIIITGLSLGGGGTWTMAQEYPKLFAAVVPVCGGYNNTSKAVNIGKENLPVWASHGDIDNVVPMSKTVNMVKAINATTPTPSPLAKLTIYKNVKHNAWDYAYRTDHSLHNPNVYEWMLKQVNKKNTGNYIPTANANSDQTKYLSSTSSTTIYGSGSDSDGSIVSWNWTKMSGPSASLSGTTSKTLKVSSLKEGTYIFRLTVKDDKGNTDSDYVRVKVKP
jgi:predicted esterase